MFGLLLAMVVGSTGVSADQATFRCGGSLIAVGDTSHRVRRLCGAPTSADRRTELRSCGPECWVEVTIDDWVYDLGTRRFVRHLTFENGTLALLEAGNFGG